MTLAAYGDPGNIFQRALDQGCLPGCETDNLSPSMYLLGQGMEISHTLLQAEEEGAALEAVDSSLAPGGTSNLLQTETPSSSFSVQPTHLVARETLLPVFIYILNVFFSFYTRCVFKQPDPGFEEEHIWNLFCSFNCHLVLCEDRFVLCVTATFKKL